MDTIEQHWKNMSSTSGTNLSATTKCPSIKKLELNELYIIINSILKNDESLQTILEVGCGNGYNLIALKKMFPMMSFSGVDYIQEMINNAKKLAMMETDADIDFYVGNILELEQNKDIMETYDIVFTDRCLINLPTEKYQVLGFKQLANKTRRNGYLILIENFMETYNEQNLYRSLLNLDKRVPDDYNRFMDERLIMGCANDCRLNVCDIRDFGSLHDLLLYVLLPKLNGGEIDYNHPLINIVTDFSISASKLNKNKFGALGQNRLYVFQKE